MVFGSRFGRFAGAFALLVSTAHQLSIPTQDAATALTARDDDPSANTTLVEPRADKRPIWMIAHKCLDRKGIDDAISHGSNAFEMDLTAYPTGWWAQHPNEKSWDSIKDLFEHLASKRRDGKNVQWVWLDIKTPNDHEGEHPGSVKRLQDLVQKILQPAGMGALYGFSVTGKGLDYIKGNLKAGEGINFDASAPKGKGNVTPPQALKHFTDEKPTVGKDKRIGSYGWDELSASFGDCTEKDFYTCAELKHAHESGDWAKVFGWTAAGDEDKMVNQLFDTAVVDGMIHGFWSTKYYDHAQTRDAARIIKDWVKKNDGKAKIADAKGPMPWS